MTMIEQQNIHGMWEDYHPKAKAVDPVPNRANLRSELQSGHLPMFMTGNEIKEHYAPLELDKAPAKHNIFENESDSELWTRKEAEARQTPLERYGEMGIILARQAGKLKGINPKVSLAEHIAKNGPVQKSVHLEMRTPGTASGKPQVAGGHHRVAISAAEFPNHLLPVEHHDSAHKAMKEKNYS